MTLLRRYSLPDKVEEDQATDAEVGANVVNAALGIYRLVRVNRNNGGPVNDKAKETARQDDEQDPNIRDLLG